MKADGLGNPTARLFSNPAGDYGSMVNERVGASNWEDGKELGDTWASRNAFSYGRYAPVSPRQKSTGPFLLVYHLDRLYNDNH